MLNPYMFHNKIKFKVGLSTTPCDAQESSLKFPETVTATLNTKLSSKDMY